MDQLINARNEVGDTPLHCAAKVGNLDMVQRLVEHGANFRLRNYLGETPLDQATDNDQYAVVEYLEQLEAVWEEYDDEPQQTTLPQEDTSSAMMVED